METPVQAVDHLSLTLVKHDGCGDAMSDGQRPPEHRDCAWPLTHVVIRPSALVGFFGGFKSVIRGLVKGLYLFPLLLAVKFFFWIVGNPIGDYISIAFVALVVITFFLISILVLLYPFVGPPSARQRKVNLDLVLPERGAAKDALARAQVNRVKPRQALELTESGTRQAGSGPVRLRGRVSVGVGDEPGEPVLQESWAENEGVVASLCAARTFALVVEGQPPIVVDLQAAPWMVGEYGAASPWPEIEAPVATRLEAWLKSRSKGTFDLATVASSAACVIRVGDEVEVIAWDWERAPNQDDLTVRGRGFSLAQSVGPNAPYRSGHARPALIVRSTPSAPAILRVVGGSGG